MKSNEIGETDALFQQFQRDGYLVLEGYFSGKRIAKLRAAVTRVLGERAGEVVVDSMETGRRTLWVDTANKETRLFKINDLYLVSDEVREIALEERLVRLLAALLGEPPVLCQSINFNKGSGQPKHIDSLFMTPRTPHALVATWTALEDAHPDSGPLLYYPGSHKIPLYNFQDGTHHFSPEELPAWHAYIDGQLLERGLEAKTFPARKGDVFIWHADLVHGGGRIANPSLTRESLVCHYYGEADCRAQGTRMVRENAGYWMPRLAHAVKTPPELFSEGRPFPEAAYLERHPDVRQAVEAGHWPSGRVHYEKIGFSEGRGV